MRLICLAVSLLTFFALPFPSSAPGQNQVRATNAASSENATPAEKVKSSAYEPPVVVSASSVVYPITSVAWGTVILNVRLDAAGNIRSIETIHGIPSLTDPAIAAAKKWRFRPATFKGKPVASSVPLAFTFVPPSVGPRP